MLGRVVLASLVAGRLLRWLQEILWAIVAW